MIISVIWLLYPALGAFAASVSSAVGRGNILYQEEKFDEALEEYNEAQAILPDSDIINYNIGVARYKKGDYQGAIEAFIKAFTTDDVELEAKVNYNIGNSKYKQGELKETTDLKDAISIYKETLDYYKRSIEISEKDNDAKFNHEFIERKIEILMDKLKQQDQQEQNKKDEKEEQKDKQQQADQEGQREEEKGERKEEDEKKEGEKGDGEEKEQDEPKESGLDSEEETEEMSEEEARLLLEGYRQEEESKGKIIDKKKGVPHRVLKDW